MTKVTFIEEKYEPMVEYKEDNLNILFTLPKKIFHGSTMELYKLNIIFIEPTYIKLEYRSRMGSTIFTCTLNLSDKIPIIVSKILDYLDSSGYVYKYI